VVEGRGYTPLMVALERRRSASFIKLLMKHGSDPDYQAKNGKTAHDLASSEAVARLLKR